MQAFFLDAAVVSAVAGALALLVVLLRPLLHRRYTARLRCAVWWVLALWLCLPLKFTLPQAPVRLAVPRTVAEQTVALPRLGQQAPAGEDTAPGKPAASSAAQAPASQQARPAAGRQSDAASAAVSAAPAAPPQGPNAPARPVSAQPQAAAQPASPGLKLQVWQLAVLGWALAALAVLTVRLSGYLLWCRRTLRWNRPVQDEALLTLAAKAAAAAGARRPAPLYWNPCAACPMAAGLLRPKLLLPEGLPADDQTAMMLVHEYTHLARRDIALKALLVLASGLHWFNPAVWLMARAAGEDIELACDETALRGRPARWRDAYSRALVAGAASPRALLATHFAAGKKNMMQRLAAVFDKKNKKKGVLVFTALLLTAALAVGLVACGVGEGVLEGAGGEPLPEGAVAIRAGDGEALEETLWNGLLTLEPVTERVPQNDMPVSFLSKAVDSEGRLGNGDSTSQLFFDEARQVGLAVEEGEFDDMPHVKRTEDGGKTWILADTSQAAVASPMGAYRELYLRPSLDGAVVLEYAVGNMTTGGTYIYHLMSIDQGKTWRVPRRPKAVRQAAKVLAQGVSGTWNKSPTARDYNMADRDNPEYVQNGDGAVHWDTASYFFAPKGSDLYAMGSGRVSLDGQRPGAVTQILSDVPGREVRLVYEGLSEVAVQDGAYLAAGEALGAAGGTQYGEGLVAELRVNGVAVPGDWLYHDFSGSDLSGWVWNAYVAPPLLDLPSEMEELARRAASADPEGKAVQLAYNLGLALLNSDEGRVAELLTGRDASGMATGDGGINPFAGLEGFVCTQAFVSVDESRAGAPAALTLDIESPGKTGLPKGRHTYCLEYRTSQDVEQYSGSPALGTVSALVPQDLWCPQNTDAQTAANLVRSWCTYGGFASGDALVKEEPGQVMLYLMVTGGTGIYTGSELKQLAEKRLDIQNFAPPQISRQQDTEHFWFIQSYTPATDTYTLIDGFDGGMADVGRAVRWTEVPQQDGTLRLTRWNCRDGLCMLPWVSTTYIMRRNEDGTWKFLSAQQEETSALVPLDGVLLSDYEWQTIRSAGQNFGQDLGGEVLSAELTAGQGSLTVKNARCETYTAAGTFQFLPEENTTQAAWRPTDGVTSVSVYENGALVCRVDDEDGAAAVREGDYPPELCGTLLYRARSAVRAEYQRQAVPAPVEITAAPADKPGTQLTDGEVERIVRTVCKGVSWFNTWWSDWLMDAAAQPIAQEYSTMGNGYRMFYWPCLEFASYSDYQKARDSVLLRAEEDGGSALVQEWQGKAYHIYGGGDRGGPVTIEPETIEVVSKERDRLEVVIGERLYEEAGIPLRKTPHTLTVQDGSWVLDSFEGDYGHNNSEEVEQARNEYYQQPETAGTNALYDQDFLHIWSAMGLGLPGRTWALADDTAWASSGREKLNFIEDGANRSIRWLQVESGAGTALYRLQEGQRNSDGSSRLLFLCKEQDGQTTWYENGKRPLVNIDLGESGDNLAEIEWTTEDQETGRRQSYFYYKEDELARKTQRIPG